MSRILRFSFLMLLLAAFHLGAYAQEQTEAKTAKVKLTKSEKKEQRLYQSKSQTESTRKGS